MKPAQEKACQDIMKRLYRRPIARMFWDSNYLTDVPMSKPLTFKVIGERLVSGCYESAYAWVSDMRTAMSSVLRATSTSDLRNAAARQLSLDFEHEMSLLSPSLSPHTLDLQFAEQQLKELLLRITPPLYEPGVIDDSPPAAEQFKLPETENVDIERLSDDIRSLCNPALLLRIFAFVHSCQPEALSIGKQTGIVFSMMNDDTIARLRQFVSSLMLDAAVGRVNPSPKVPGSSSFVPIVPV